MARKPHGSPARKGNFSAANRVQIPRPRSSSAVDAEVVRHALRKTSAPTQPVGVATHGGRDKNLPELKAMRSVAQKFGLYVERADAPLLKDKRTGSVVFVVYSDASAGELRKSRLPQHTPSLLGVALSTASAELPTDLKQRAQSHYKLAISRLLNDPTFWIAQSALATALLSQSTNPADFLKRKRDAGVLPSVVVGRKHLYPAVAVSPTAPTLHAWLAPFHKSLPDDKRGWPLMVWLNTPTPALDGKAPRQVLAETEKPNTTFLRYARHYINGLEV